MAPSASEEHTSAGSGSSRSGQRRTWTSLLQRSRIFYFTEKCRSLTTEKGDKLGSAGQHVACGHVQCADPQKCGRNDAASTLAVDCGRDRQCSVCVEDIVPTSRGCAGVQRHSSIIGLRVARGPGLSEANELDSRRWFHHQRRVDPQRNIRQ